MTSGPHIHPLAPPASPVDDQPAPAVRLRLKPKGSLAGYLDGGWWPRSRDLVVELPALVRVLAVRLGRVSRVAFPLTAWNIQSRQIIVDGREIRLEGFRHQDEHIVHVSAPDRRRITLLVIPLDTTVVAAHDAMMAASGRDNIDQPADILAAAGVAPPRLALIPEDDQDRWATDGGLREPG